MVPRNAKEGLFRPCHAWQNWQIRPATSVCVTHRRRPHVAKSNGVFPPCTNCRARTSRGVYSESTRAKIARVLGYRCRWHKMSRQHTWTRRPQTREGSTLARPAPAHGDNSCLVKPWLAHISRQGSIKFIVRHSGSTHDGRSTYDGCGTRDSSKNKPTSTDSAQLTQCQSILTL